MHVLDSRRRKRCCTGSQTPFRARDARPVLGTNNLHVNSWVASQAIPFRDISIYKILRDLPEAFSQIMRYSTVRVLSGELSPNQPKGRDFLKSLGMFLSYRFV